MKLTKKSTALLIAGIIGLGAISAPIIADENRHCGDRHGGKFSMMSEHGFAGKDPERMLNKMVRKLDLTNEQRDQAFAKLDEYQPKLRDSKFAIMDSFKTLHQLEAGNEDYQAKSTELADQQGDLIAEMIKLRLAMHADFEEILTEEQKVKFNEFKQKRGHHRKHHQDDDAQS